MHRTRAFLATGLDYLRERVILVYLDVFIPFHLKHSPMKTFQLFIFSLLLGSSATPFAFASSPNGATLYAQN